MEVGKKLKIMMENMIKDFVSEVVLWKRIYRFVGWNLVFKKWTEERGITEEYRKIILLEIITIGKLEPFQLQIPTGDMEASGDTEDESNETVFYLGLSV